MTIGLVKFYQLCGSVIISQERGIDIVKNKSWCAVRNGIFPDDLIPAIDDIFKNNITEMNFTEDTRSGVIVIGNSCLN